MQAPRELTFTAVQRQATAMGSDVYEIGLFKPDASEGEPLMLPRVWDADALLRSVAWLRNQNREGRNVYIRPRGEHDLTLVDDLSEDAIGSMKRAGFAPAVVVETSPHNFQAWLKHPGALGKELGTAVARSLSERFGGDANAADWRHFGRLAGFTNRKEKYRNQQTGLHPFVKLIEAAGRVYPEAERFLEQVRKSVAREQQERQRQRAAIHMAVSRPRGEPAWKSIEAFRSDPRYGGDGTRVDLAYGIYALSHGASVPQVEAALHSRDLSHKGSERRQRDYVARTIQKALAAVQGHRRER